MGELSKLINIGKEIERQLLEIGIESEEKLRDVGSKQAWLDIKAIDPSACYNRLCGLEGAIQGVKWKYLDDDIKLELKEFYQNAQIVDK